MNGITLMDGATGTRLWQLAEEKGFKKEPVWKYNVEHPEIVLAVAKEYVEAGSRLISSNTFTANRPAVKRSSPYSVEQIVTAGMEIAKEAAAGAGAKVALDIGPLTEMMEPYGDLEEDEVTEIYSEVIEAGMKCRPDYIYFETFIDLAMERVAAEAALGRGVPVLCSMSFEKNGKTVMGNSVEDMIRTLEPLGVSALGANCSAGPDQLLPVIREFSEKTDLPLLFKPNAGMPVIGADGKETTAYDADAFVRGIIPALPLVSFLGACCGSNASYIRALAEITEKQPQRH